MNEELKYIIGGNIRLAREKAGFSQAELAEKLGITGASISAYENGVSIPSVPVILQIAKTLNVSIDFLCGYEKSNAFSQYPEILKILLKLLQTEEVGAFIASVFDGDPYNSEQYSCIGFRNNVIGKFCSEVSDIKKLYDNGTFDDNMYSLVVNALLNKPEYNKPISPEDCDGFIPF